MRSCYLLFFALIYDLHALYYGSPALPQATEKGVYLSDELLIGVKVGYLGDRVLHKSLETTHGYQAKGVESFESYTEQGVLTLNFASRFEVYGSLGGMRINVQPKISSVVREVLQTKEELTWGFGGRGVVYELSKAVLGLDFKFQGYDPRFLWGSVNGFAANVGSTSKMSYYEWQIGLGLAYDCDFMVPYIGALYNRVEGKCSNLFPIREHFTFKSQKKFGLACGVCLVSKSFFELDLEARMVAETAFSIQGNFRF